jgi:hypothetical protein
MPKELQALLDSLDGVEQPVQSLYTKREDGKYELGYTIAGMRTQADVDTVLRAKENESKTAREARQEAERVRGILTAAGLSEEEASKILKDHKENQTKKKMERGEYDDLVKQLTEQHTTAISTANQRAETAESELETHMLDAALSRAISTHEADAELLEDNARKFLRVVKGESGKRQVVVVGGADGKTPQLSPKGDGSLMTVEEFIGSYREKGKFGKAFPAPKVGGSGAASVINNGAVVVNKKADLTSDSAKSKYISDNGLDAYLALP